MTFYESFWGHFLERMVKNGNKYLQFFGLFMFSFAINQIGSVLLFADFFTDILCKYYS